MTSAYSLAILGLLIGGFGIGVLTPNLSAWLGKIAPPDSRGKLLGGLTASIFLGQFLAPIIIQPLSQNVGLLGTFIAVGGISILLGAIYLIFGKFGSSK